MSRLPAKLNSRQEKFAQNLAMGMTKGEAYVAAGYKPDPGNPTRLTENDRVQNRVAELQKRAAIDTGVTTQAITADLTDLIKEASALPQSVGTLNAQRAPRGAHGHCDAERPCREP
jgi:phage terminase small subunit